nr:MAG TPA: hypothetical protein [Bacteriophage sp.]
MTPLQLRIKITALTTSAVLRTRQHSGFFMPKI